MTVPILQAEFQGKKLFFTDTPTAPALIKEIFGDNYEVMKKGITFGPGDVILDIGANEGMFSIMMSALFPEARIIALEPVPRTHFHLTRNLAMNSVRNVHAFNVGIGAPGKREATFNVSMIYSGGSTSKCTFNPDEQFQVPVKLMSLAEAFDLYAIDRCKLMKMDVEGMEYEILYPAEEILKRTEMIAIEVHMNQKLDFESRRVDGLINWIANRTKILHVDVCKMAE